MKTNTLLPNIPKVNKMLYKKKDENLQEKRKLKSSIGKKSIEKY